MEKSLIEITVSLTGTSREGMYKMKYYTWPIERETDKTITIIRSGNLHRELVSNLNVPRPTRKNNKFNELGFTVTCRPENKEIYAEELHKAIINKMSELSKIHSNVTKAFEGGYKLLPA